MAKDYLFLCLVVLQVMPHAFVNGAGDLKSARLCSQCSKCDTSKCPPSEAYPHMTAFDDTLIAGALQSDYVDLNDRGVYSVPNIKGGESTTYNAYYGWQSTLVQLPAIIGTYNLLYCFNIGYTYRSA